MAECLVCGTHFTAKRSDAKTCSNKCRAKLRRERIRQQKKAQGMTMTLSEFAYLERIGQDYPEAKNHLVKLFSLHGRDALTMAIDAIDLICYPDS